MLSSYVVPSFQRHKLPVLGPPAWIGYRDSVWHARMNATLIPTNATLKACLSDSGGLPRGGHFPHFVCYFSPIFPASSSFPALSVGLQLTFFKFCSSTVSSLLFSFFQFDNYKFTKIKACLIHTHLHTLNFYLLVRHQPAFEPSSVGAPQLVTCLCEM